MVQWQGGEIMNDGCESHPSAFRSSEVNPAPHRPSCHPRLLLLTVPPSQRLRLEKRGMARQLLRGLAVDEVEEGEGSLRATGATRSRTALEGRGTVRLPK